MILYFYTFLKSIGHELEYIPIVDTKINLGDKLPTLEEFKSTIPYHTLDEEEITALFSNLPTTNYLRTSEEFYLQTVKVYSR